MPIFQLDAAFRFPSPHLATEEGLLAVGGDLSLPRLLLAYSMGIFPWFNADDPLLWWSPSPRCILDPITFQPSRSLAKRLRQGLFSVSIDQAFEPVVRACAETPRQGQDGGTWIDARMMTAYRELFSSGFAHSLECWRDGELMGGLYGIVLGKCFFGESMFHRQRDASKVALAHLVDFCRDCGIALIDCQVTSPHLLSLGAMEVSRGEFMTRLKAAQVDPSPWQTPQKFP
ncbi:MAG: leucyl/phenylalanyl-tRNA--protein transferase [Desulfuromonas sp.]|nr:MAG: leucyl/phenylalanyl-tRNA--protein transferase [Desulfuromonas sp.]